MVELQGGFDSEKGGKELRVEEFRPVSLNEVSYKIFGAIMREKLGRFVERGTEWLFEGETVGGEFGVVEFGN